MTETTTPSLLVRTRLLVWVCLGALVALYGYMNAVSEFGSITIWLIGSGTLLMFVPGMIKDHAKTYDWLCFVTLIHFLSATTGSMSPSGNWADYLHLLLTVTLFIAAMLTSRWLKAWQYHLNQFDSDGAT